MTIFQAIILGLIQGLTEFIPVSSSGHLVLAHHFWHISSGGLNFDAALNIGTLTALIMYFHGDIWRLIRAVFTKQPETRLAWFIAAATIPAAIAGLLLEEAAETAFRSPRLVAANLMIVALLMLLAERFYRRQTAKHTNLTEIKAPQALAMGVAQAAALVPGVSRSGSTITAGLFMGVERVAAMRFSFLLGIPIMLGGIAKRASEPGFADQVSAHPGLYVAGILAAFASGFLAISFLLKYLSNHSLNLFAYYRLALGAAVLLILIL